MLRYRDLGLSEAKRAEGAKGAKRPERGERSGAKAEPGATGMGSVAEAA